MLYTSVSVLLQISSFYVRSVFRNVRASELRKEHLLFGKNA